MFYQEAKKRYAEIGIDTDKAIETLKNIPISLHCWQGDDVTGFDHDGPLTGGIQTTGNYPGKARTPDELMADMDVAMRLMPGKKKLNLHASYSVFASGEFCDRDKLEPKHFAKWVEFAKKRHMGIDFNPTFFSHDKVKDNLTLTSPDEDTRNFWINHGKACIRIAEYFARETGVPCVMNIWIGDGFKDIPADRLGPRLRYKDSLDQILSVPYDKDLVKVCVESKVFGVGVEAYTAGSAEFALTFAATHPGCLPLMDNGHYHPTEVVSDKIPALLAFFPEIALHITRPVRWDSDHVVIFDDETREMAKEIVRCDALDRVHMALDFFDAGINRIAAWVTGFSAWQKALLNALLTPHALLKSLQDENNMTALMMQTETLKSYPFGEVWDEYCRACGVPAEKDLLQEIRAYEEAVLLKRNTGSVPPADFITMCKTIGAMPDYVQGGGGNASCKYGNNSMAIKASGFAIRDITDNSGYVNVDYKKILAYHTAVPASELEEREKNSTPFTLSCVQSGSTLRPSVETGFHSLMKKYVMHTHPVYTNVLTCAEGGEKLVKTILKDTDFVWIPYINPGFSLTLVIDEAIQNYKKENGVFPKVIFLENHGLVTTSDDAEECTKLHVAVNNAIKEYFKLGDFYTGLTLSEVNGALSFKAPFIKDFMSKYGPDLIDSLALYPDQLVYLNAGIKDGKIAFDADTAIFKTTPGEAAAMLETFAAFVYIIDSIHASGLKVHPMNSVATNFINNWESEKYRKAMAK